MNRVWKPRLFAILLIVTSGICVTWADPAWARAIGVDVWNLDQLHDELRSSRTAGQYLDLRTERLFSRFELNQLMLEDLIDQRRTLTDVASEMWEENRELDGYRYVIENLCSGDSLLQRSAMNLIIRVSCTLQAHPERHKIVVARLLKEYQAAFGKTIPLESTIYRGTIDTK